MNKDEKEATIAWTTPNPCRDLHRPRDQRLPAGRVLICNSALRDARQKGAPVIVLGACDKRLLATGGLLQRRAVHRRPVNMHLAK